MPEYWCGPIHIYNGYSGGLGPDNLESELRKIEQVTKPEDEIWIDMETKIRSDDNKTFDLNKVRRCLEIVKPWIG